jgi:arylsulfatase A-like enzyme
MKAMARPMRTIVLGGAIAVTALAAAPNPIARPEGIVVITLDTTRADRLPAYGFHEVATPAIDRLALEGVVFDEAESVAPLTLVAHTSLFTGLYPPHHGVRDNLDTPLDRSVASLPELLQRRGFQTAAFVGSVVLAGDRGVARGFDVYRDVHGVDGHGEPVRRRPGAEVVDEAIEWIDQLTTRHFCLWVHLYDAHAPRSLPLEVRRVYGNSYEGAIAYMDSQVGRLLDALEHKKLLGTSAIVLAGDHGESLGEHGEREHGIFLYEAALRVPLVIRAPGLMPRRIQRPVSLVDVMPTALDLVAEAPLQSIDGESLVPALRDRRGRAPADRSVYAESMYAQRFGWAPLRMIRDGGLKYIDAPRPELYDLYADPSEQHDLSAERPSTVAALRRALEGMARGPSVDRASDSVSAERLRTLASLGYVGGHSSLPSTPSAGGLDPKDFIGIYNSIRNGRLR